MAVSNSKASGAESAPPPNPSPRTSRAASSPGANPSDDRIYSQTSSVGDSAAEIDELGFELYVNAIADFLVSPNTRPPLTCSVEGAWGSGKSSFMLQLRKRLEAVSPACRTIQFNAWKYDKQEELWAAFALKVARSLRESMSRWQRVRRDTHLFRTRIRGWSERLSLLALLLAWLLIMTGATSVMIWAVRATYTERVGLIKGLVGAREPGPAANGQKPAESISSQPAKPLEPWYNWLSWSPPAAAAIVIVLLFGKLPESLRKRLFDAQLERYIDRPDYKGKAAFVDAFSEDFSKMIEAYTPPDNGKIFVFIDDLDRCEAPKAADLMQAINVMIGEGNPLIFILGLDRAKVASAIAFKFHEIIPYLDPAFESDGRSRGILRFGEDFLEKFIQLSFRLPVSSNEQQARRFVDSLITGDPGRKSTTDTTFANLPAESARRALRIESGAESERIRDVVMVVREVLDYSPRRIKTFLNVFRLALYVASAQGLLDVDSGTGEAEVTPERLGKFLALTNRYPEIRARIEQDPDFLRNLETAALGGTIEKPSSVAPWSANPGMKKLMTAGIEGETPTVTWSRRYSMRDFPAWKFSTILPRVAPPASTQRNAASAPAAAPAGASQSSASAGPASTPAPADRPSLIQDEDADLEELVEAGESAEEAITTEFSDRVTPRRRPSTSKQRPIARKK